MDQLSKKKNFIIVYQAEANNSTLICAILHWCLIIFNIYKHFLRTNNVSLSVMPIKEIWTLISATCILFSHDYILCWDNHLYWHCTFLPMYKKMCGFFCGCTNIVTSIFSHNNIKILHAQVLPITITITIVIHIKHT